MSKRFRRTESAVLNGGSPRHSGWTGPHNGDTMDSLVAQAQRNPNVLTLAQKEAVARRYPNLRSILLGVLWLTTPLCALGYIIQAV